MKRKLIDIKEETLEVLSADAEASGTNLKRYIETMLDQRARDLEDKASYRYNLSMSREPSDRELYAIMSAAASAAQTRNSQTLTGYFSDLEQIVKSVR